MTTGITSLPAVRLIDIDPERRVFAPSYSPGWKVTHLGQARQPAGHRPPLSISAVGCAACGNEPVREGSSEQVRLRMSVCWTGALAGWLLGHGPRPTILKRRQHGFDLIRDASVSPSQIGQASRGRIAGIRSVIREIGALRWLSIVRLAKHADRLDQFYARPC